jgi:two-component system invasion response regulator UvrY
MPAVGGPRPGGLPILSGTVSVLLVDESPIVREGCRRVFQETGNIRVIAEAQNGEAACAQYVQEGPDLVVLEPRMRVMPGMGGLETIQKLKLADPGARILVFSDSDDETAILRTLRAGARGYLAKTRPVEHLIDAVRVVARGEHYIDATRAADMLSAILSGVPAGPLEPLSPREYELFRLFAEGRSTAEIARALSISPKTVGVHHTAIMRKLAITSVTQLVRLALRCDVIDP